MKRVRSDYRENGAQAPQEDLRDLGFGSRVSEESRQRLLNRDGSFNVSRVGLSFFESINAYHTLLNLSWFRFYVSVFAIYCLINVLFALAYVAAGPTALSGLENLDLGQRFLKCFFFSVQTFTTVGYGHVSPNTLGANILVMLETFVGLFLFALSTGLLFARFSRPTARILFSNRAIIAPYRGGRAFEFRIVNMRKSQLIEVDIRLMVSWVEEVDGRRMRQYRMLDLERGHVSFFPLHWTIVHNITSQSPIASFTPEVMRDTETEFLVLLTGMDDTFSTTVHARMSYRHNEVVWGARFTDMFLPSTGNETTVGVDLRQLHAIEPAQI